MLTFIFTVDEKRQKCFSQQKLHTGWYHSSSSSQCFNDLRRCPFLYLLSPRTALSQLSQPRQTTSHFSMDCFTGLFRVLPMPLSHTKGELILKVLANFILPILAECSLVCVGLVSEKEKAQEYNYMCVYIYIIIMFLLSNLITESLHLYTSTIQVTY